MIGNALEVLLLGLLGVFFVIGVIMGAIVLLAKVSTRMGRRALERGAK
ncbi:MAG: hypothetical protein FWG25_01490 [Promicromonosporaceae bacterium]|nr:hypothetical protein [Promicromonosporaceae bacterium]